MMTENTKAWLQMQLCVVLWGFTAILGKLIQLSALSLVWWRMFLVGLMLLVIPRFWLGVRGMPRTMIVSNALLGALLASHWVVFYEAIKVSNASIAVTFLALCPVLTSLVERVLWGRKLQRLEVALGLAMVPAVALVVGATPSDLRYGAVLGVAAAVLDSLYVPLSKRHTGDHDVIAVSGLQMIAGGAFLSFIVWLRPFASDALSLPDAHDIGLLLVLALLCTLVPYAVMLLAMRRLSAFSVALSVNLEPVYAIGLASLFLGEQRQLSPYFYLGVLLILLLVGLHPWLARRREQGNRSLRASDAKLTP